MNRRALLASLMLILAGCASQQPPLQNLAGSLSPRAGMAYAVVSLSSDDTQPSSTYLNARYSAVALQQGITMDFGRSIQTALANDRIGSGEGSIPGRVFLLELEPGRYQFFEANSHWPDASGREPFSQSNRLLMQHSFDVAPGDALYLGEIRLNLSKRPQVNIIDAHERDFRVIRNEWKINDLSPLKVKLLQADSTK